MPMYTYGLKERPRNTRFGSAAFRPNHPRMLGLAMLVGVVLSAWSLQQSHDVQSHNVLDARSFINVGTRVHSNLRRRLGIGPIRINHQCNRARCSLYATPSWRTDAMRTLGLELDKPDREITLIDLRRAFHKQVRRYHPDLADGDTKLFLEARSAFELLQDEQESLAGCIPNQHDGDVDAQMDDVWEAVGYSPYSQWTAADGDRYSSRSDHKAKESSATDSPYRPHSGGGAKAANVDDGAKANNGANTVFSAIMVAGAACILLSLNFEPQPPAERSVAVPSQPHYAQWQSVAEKNAYNHEFAWAMVTPQKDGKLPPVVLGRPTIPSVAPFLQVYTDQVRDQLDEHRPQSRDMEGLCDALMAILKEPQNSDDASHVYKRVLAVVPDETLSKLIPMLKKRLALGVEYLDTLHAPFTYSFTYESDRTVCHFMLPDTEQEVFIVGAASDPEPGSSLKGLRSAFEKMQADIVLLDLNQYDYNVDEDDFSKATGINLAKAITFMAPSDLKHYENTWMKEEGFTEEFASIMSPNENVSLYFEKVPKVPKVTFRQTATTQWVASRINEPPS